MIVIDEIEKMRLFKKPFYLPIDIHNKLKNNSVLLLTPHYDSTVKLLNNPLLIKKHYQSYYIEKDIMYIINHEGYIDFDKTEDLLNEVELANPKLANPILSSSEFKHSTKLNKNLTRRLKMQYRTAKYKLNQMSDLDRNNVGVSKKKKEVSDKIEDKKSVEIENESVYYGKEISWMWDYLKYTNKISENGYIKYYFDSKETGNPAGCIILNTDNKEVEFEINRDINIDFDKVLQCFIYYALYTLGCKGVKIEKSIYNKYEEYFISLFDPHEEINEYIHLKLSISDYLGESCEFDDIYNGEKVYVGYCRDEVLTEDNCIKLNNGDYTNTMYVLEDSIYNTQFKRILYKDRLRTNKDVFGIYDMIKQDVPYINRTYIDYQKYKNKNLIIDTFFYNSIFANKNIWINDKAVNLYFDLINRFIDDNRLTPLGYNKLNTVLVPISDWIENEESLDYKKNVNLISVILRLVKTSSDLLQKWKGVNFIFLTTKGYFSCDLSTLNKQTVVRFKVLLNKLINGDPIVDDDPNKESTKAIMINIVDKIEDDAHIQINKLTGDKVSDSNKKEVIDKIEKAAEISNNSDETLDKLDTDERIKKILDDLSNQEEDKVKINNARLSRMMSAQDVSKNKTIQGTPIRTILSKSLVETEIPKTELKIDSVNEEWKDLKYINFEQSYDIREDILNILYSFSDKSEPVVVRDIDVEDTSTSEDLKETYTVKFEDSHGQRFTIKFDLPKFVDDKFMRLRGNEKTINGQLTLIPILKTDEDTVQMISNYKKIFIYRYGSSVGKSYPTADKINKVLNKYDGKDVKVVYGDNSVVCSKYDLPIDYLDLAASYNTIENDEYIIYFNQDLIREKYKVNESKGIPIAYNKKSKEIIYWGNDNYHNTCSDEISGCLLRGSSDKLREMWDNTKYANKYMYSRANILNNKIPLIVIMAHSEGLEKSMKKANINYWFTEKREKPSSTSGVIQFNDGYLGYSLDYNSSLLMNGLKECNTEDYSIKDINNKSIWLDFLDIFGGRLLSDGLDNFYDLMIDSVTKEVLQHYKLPTDYVELLAYANLLLSDNKYIKHTDMTARRYRSNELVAGYTYQALAEAYGSYRTEYKKRGTASMTMKQSAIIDKVMLDPTCADLSMLNDIQNAESINALSYKGLAGLNHDRSYDLEKRAYDESMLNVVAMSTGFAGNVGVTRQATIDMNIEGKRGYIKTIDNDTDKMSITKSFGITEALTPFGTTRDDPMRSAMNFIQTSKHGMRVNKSTPLLISNGADMALPYITSNVFSFNAKNDGKVIELTDDYMIVEYKDKTKDFIDLRNNIRKNSNGGFYQSIKLSTDLKVGNRVKKDEVIAYDRMSYSNEVGPTDDLAFSNWTLTKVAMLTTDEGFEDSAIVSEWLSDAMASRVVIKKEYVLPKTTNVYSMVKKGQAIEEGDTLMIFQNSFDDEDINILLKNLSDDEELITDLGRIPVKSKVTGFVEDIKVYRTVDKSELSDSLKKIVTDLEKPANSLKKAMDKHDLYDPSKVEPTYALEKSGKLKNVDEGVMIEFYLSYDDKMSVGDKLIYSAAVKGVVKDVIPNGKEPYSEFRKDEKIHTLVPYFGVANRIVCSIFSTMPINKVIVELDRKIKDMCDIPYKFLDED